jgi:hypothetical protein
VTDRPASGIQPVPDAISLLRVAREALKTLVDELPDRRRYEALMILNAIAVSIRELERDGGRDRRWLEDELSRFLGAYGPLDSMWRLVVAELRSGDMSDERRRALHGLLERYADVRLAVANPKHARADGDSG